MPCRTPEIGLAGLLLDYPNSGSAVYARNLVPLLPKVAPDLRFSLFVRRAEVQQSDARVHRLRSPFAQFNHGRGIGAQLDKLAWEELNLPIAAAAARNALLHSLYFAAPIVSSTPVVVTIHDVIPLVLPGYHRSRQSALYTRLMAWSVKRVSAIITVSQHSKADIMNALGIPENRVHVTYEAADERFRPEAEPGELEKVQAKYGLPERFVLYTGGAEKRKNLVTLVRAWARARSTMRRHDVRLVIVAAFPPPDNLYPDVPGLVGRLGLSEDIVLLPQIDEQDKPAVYRAAIAFCFPSMYEGFGFTPLEAMASGTPVLASNVTSIPEVVGEGGWLLDPYDVDAWAEAIRQVVESERIRMELRKRGIQRSYAFSWRRTAEQTVQVYRRVLGL